MNDTVFAIEGELNGYKTWKLAGEVQGIVIQVRLNLEQSARFVESFPVEGCRVAVARLGNVDASP